MKDRDILSKPKVLNFAISKVGGIQPNAFERSMRTAAKMSLFPPNLSNFFNHL